MGRGRVTREAADAAPPIVDASAADVLDAIARVIVSDDMSPTRIGSVTLHPHQREGADRVRRIIDRHGGALLCDAVGVGKTYIALAVAHRFERTVIVAPAVLRDMWLRAVAATGVRATFVSVESLGRGRSRIPGAPFVIVDEAHHLRNPATRRYDAAARLCASACTLLLTATPLHNTRRDLAALVALFAGVRAHAWTDEELTSVVVRRDQAVVAPRGMPRVEHAPVCTVSSGDERVLDELLALPPPVPPADGGDAGPLVAHSLVRQWASSSAALAGALRRRIARGRALLAALDDGRYPSRAELREWVCTEESVQLAFTQMLVTSPASDPALRVALDRHVDALATLLRRVEADVAVDDERATLVHRICARHPGRRVVAFTCYQDTAEMLYRALRSRARSALLTARGGVVAGGRLSREETLTRFAPEASGRRRVADHERIDLLIATDLLSEGVNLQDASIAIHLDLPWTSARLTQRIGRVARLGSRHDVVTAYTFRPSPRAEAIVHAAQIVQRKALLATRILGATPDLAGAPPTLASMPDAQPSTPLECAETIQRLLRRCRRRDTTREAPRDDTVPVARINVPGAREIDERALVACLIDGAPQLVVVERSVVRTSIHTVLAALEMALGGVANGKMDAAKVAPIVRVVEAWHARRSAARDAGVELPMSDGRVRAALRARRHAIGRLDGVVSATPFAHRAAAAARAATLRGIAAEPMPLGVERMLYADEATDIATTLDHAAIARASAADQHGLRIVALLLLAPSG